MSLILPLVNTPVGWSFFRTMSTRSPGWRLLRTVPERALAAVLSVISSSMELDASVGTTSSLKRPRNCSFGSERTYGEQVPLRIVCIACALLILFTLKRMQSGVLADASKVGIASDISITCFRSMRYFPSLRSLENMNFYLANM